VSVVVIAPHPDDESIGCGGAIALHVDAGEHVSIVFLTSGERSHPDRPADEIRGIREAEAREATRILGVASVHFMRGPDSALDTAGDEMAMALRPLLDEAAPSLIYLPHEAESHPDYAVTLGIVRRCVSDLSIARPYLRLYEVWTPIASPNDVVDVSAVMARKLRAIRCHRSQIETFAYDRAARGLNAYRGEMFAKCRYAEAFMSTGLELDA
jgi:LmbE family N-acetylglucosaminyl deacetylase